MADEAVLIVDDNLTNLKLAKVLLTSEGYRVRTAIDAEQALEILTEFQPRLILMDIQLPGMDGLELTRLLKADPKTRDITVVALTAYAMKGDDEKALASGCSGYISKPIDTRRFGAEVARYLQGSGTEAKA
ncbi:MAG: response regulator [Gammaproteobacteria bacterium]|nr:response regulator [Gammaproteobacteria bacterium]